MDVRKILAIGVEAAVVRTAMGWSVKNAAYGFGITFTDTLGDTAQVRILHYRLVVL
ncbi:hypothetical protein X474_01295 [Dethiosulfatarculus sandiegensis]|uniref:Uncharacterized protein n=1 Tax=Dethiosulfatarculus sandiegensis TaxID=1429043 RepID=A0A0D2GN91_9BACT|nr:hypothetical protein X474_01295 [Dethiosulfatarculus sandiegensis]